MNSPKEHTDAQSLSTPSRRSSVAVVLTFWPAVVGAAFGIFLLLTDDSDSVDGVILPLVLATAAYALIAFLGRPAWSWSLLGVVVVIDLVAEAMSLSSGAWRMAAVTFFLVVAGLVLNRWSAAPTEMRWQPWGATAFTVAAVAALGLDAGVGRVVIALSLLGHAAWDIAHWRRKAVVSRSLAQWCAFLDLTLGTGILVADFGW